MSRESLIEALRKLKDQILRGESNSIRLSEQDTRQGLINPLFGELGWDFSDFTAVRAEFRDPRYNEPADYAFFGKDAGKPLLLAEAKALGTDLNNAKIIKQLCTYLGEIGVQWGLLTDGNKYIMYNANAGASFEDQKFLTMQIKTADTDDGIPMAELASKLQSLLSRGCLEDDRIQKFYESHVIDSHIEDALLSLLSEPFDTLAAAIRKELKEERVKVTSLVLARWSEKAAKSPASVASEKAANSLVRRALQGAARHGARKRQESRRSERYRKPRSAYFADTELA